VSMTKRFYEVCVFETTDAAEPCDTDTARGRKAVAPVLAAMIQKHPRAFIIARQYYRDQFGRLSYRVLHRLTYDGTRTETA
jgi:hypothetical protein